MIYKLPTLPYPLSALAPHISEQTMTNHYQHHHQTYVNKLNDLLASSPDMAHLSLEALIKQAQGPLFNNAAQHWNHNFFWQCLTPDQQPIPQTLLSSLTTSFGSVDDFKKAFLNAALARFGSGWTWLVILNDNKLDIISTPNAENPLTHDQVKSTLLGCDVWEHAYYLDTQYNRAAYLDNFWSVVNWQFVAEQHAKG
ncbi:MAG: superoxide dismutase [Pseudomonadota bacterium]|nr:superoxide dismutase [Pseudomonadota bacterium]